MLSFSVTSISNDEHDLKISKTDSIHDQESKKHNKMRDHLSPTRKIKFRGLKLHQIKAKCQASENKLTGPDKRCFASLTDVLNILFLKFGDTIYCKTLYSNL